MKGSRFRWGVWGARILLLSLLCLFLIRVGIIDPSYVNATIVLFCTTFLFFGASLLRPRSDPDALGSNLIATSLIGIGLSFSGVLIATSMYGISMSNPYLSALGIMFIVSTLGAIAGGLIQK